VSGGCDETGSFVIRHSLFVIRHRSRITNHQSTGLPDRVACGHRHHRILAPCCCGALNKARENRSLAACMSNIKQLGLTFLLYSEDFDSDCRDAVLDSFTRSGRHRRLTATIPSLLEKRRGLQCPSDPEHTLGPAGTYLDYCGKAPRSAFSPIAEIPARLHASGRNRHDHGRLRGNAAAKTMGTGCL